MRINWNNGSGDQPDPKQVASAMLDRLQLAIERKLDEMVSDIQGEVWALAEQVDQLTTAIGLLLTAVQKIQQNSVDSKS